MAILSAHAEDAHQAPEQKALKGFLGGFAVRICLKVERKSFMLCSRSGAATMLFGRFGQSQWFRGRCAHIALNPLCGGFVSWQAVTWVLEQSEATLGSRLVLLSIASHANREGLNAFPSMETIGREALLSEREVRYCVRALEESGELHVERGVGRGNSNKYALPRVLSWLEKVQSLPHLRKRKGAQGELKGAIQNTKGAICAEKSDLTLSDSNKSKTERLEPIKHRTVKQVSKILSIPEPSKNQAQIRAERDRQIAAMKEKGYLQ